jgi:hypothetical protein
MALHLDLHLSRDDARMVPHDRGQIRGVGERKVLHMHKGFA